MFDGIDAGLATGGGSYLHCKAERAKGLLESWCLRGNVDKHEPAHGGKCVCMC